MVEAQSRYGIMEELNNRKISEKEKLSNIERQYDNELYNREKQINQIMALVQSKEQTYKQEHKDRVRNLEVTLQMITHDFEREKKDLESKIADEKENYEDRFQDWKEKKLEEVANLTESKNRYIKEQDNKIKDKKCVINEIEEGIKSLKEMSKEQKKD